jgi:hypothetical protein
MNFSKADSSTLVLTKTALVGGTASKTAQARAYIKKLNTVTVVRGVVNTILLFPFYFSSTHKITNYKFSFSFFNTGRFGICIINQPQPHHRRFHTSFYYLFTCLPKMAV